MRKIPIAGPWITELEVQAVTKAVQNEWYEQANLSIEEFENNFKIYVDRSYAISLPSCTSGLHLALLSLNIGPGDEVIIPDATWIASSAPISYVGATPVFVDIDANTWCLDIASVEQAITPHTKAIIAVDLYGGMPNWDALYELANKYNLAIIEDAAEAVGAAFKGRLAGTFGDISVFSFHGSKTLSCGEGGMLLTDNVEIYKKCLALRDHGRAPGDIEFYNLEVAYKYKMSNLQAALGKAQLSRIDELIAKKRQIFKWYQEALQGIDDIKLNYEPKDTLNSYWMVTLELGDSYNCDAYQLRQDLKRNSIDTRPFFHPLSSLPAYKHLSNNCRSNKNSYKLSSRAFNLPSALKLEASDIEYVTQQVKSLLQDKVML